MTVFTRLSNVVRHPNIRWRARSFAASVHSAVPEVQRVPKRVSKDERQAMVESFVNKYRAVNAGKFPTVSHAKKQAGGSYYVVRKILQELEYKSRYEHNLGEKAAKEKKSSLEVEDVSGVQMAMDAEICKDAQEVAGNSSNFVAKQSQELKEEAKEEYHPCLEEAEEDVRVSTSSDMPKGDSSNLVAKQSQELKEEAKEEYHPCPGKAEEDARVSTSSDLLDLDGETANAEQHQHSPESDASAGSFVAKQRQELKEEAKKEYHPCPEKAEEDARVGSSNGMLDLDGENANVKQHQHSLESDASAENLPEKQSEDEQHSKKPSTWDNFKALADDFINMWRKM